MLQRQGYATDCIGKWHFGMSWTGRKSDSLVVGDRMTEGPTALGFDFFYGYTHARNIATVIEQDRVVATLAHEHENQPLMIAKAVFLANGARELYNLAEDIGETRNLAAASPDVMARLTVLFQRFIDEGRSTPGEPRLNEFALSLDPKPRCNKKPRSP